MQRAERILVHTVLVVLLIAVFSDRPFVGATAEADPSRIEEVVGPADRLVLLRGGKEVEVTSAENGLSWGDRPTARSWSLGAVDVPRLLGVLMDSERFAEDRKALQNEAETQNREFEERFESFREANGEITPEDPEFARAQGTWQAMMQEYQQWQQGTLAIQQKLGAEQVETAYRELAEAVDIVAEREGIEIVFRFVPVSDPFLSDTIDLASDQVRRRILLRYPDAIDLTSKVESELGL